jgi:hypothetical protein
MPKPFAWSYSKLKNFRSCPKRHYEIDIAKTYKDDDSDALVWGNQVHDAMAKRCGKGVKLPEIMEHYNEWPTRIDVLRAGGFNIKVEQKLAMNDKFKPVGFFDNTAWFRGVVDVLGLGTRKALGIDWKTGGKINPDFEQLGLSAQLIFAHHPEIDQVETYYVWLGHTNNDGSDVVTHGSYTRAGMTPVWNEVWPWIKTMAEAHRTLTYPPKPSGLCIRYCPVVSCPYHGKGNR